MHRIKWLISELQMHSRFNPAPLIKTDDTAKPWNNKQHSQKHTHCSHKEPKTQLSWGRIDRCASLSVRKRGSLPFFRTQIQVVHDRLIHIFKKENTDAKWKKKKRRGEKIVDLLFILPPNCFGKSKQLLFQSKLRMTSVFHRSRFRAHESYAYSLYRTQKQWFWYYGWQG